MKKYFLSVIIAVMVLSFSACTASEVDVSSQDSSSQTSSQASATATPSPTATPTPETSSEAQEPEEIASFEELFAENPIDKALNDELATASTTSKIVNAYKNAKEDWKNQVDVSYEYLVGNLSGDEKTEIKNSYDTWHSELGGKIAEINSKYEGNAVGEIDGEFEILNLYKSKDMEFKEKIFELTGEVDFTRTPSAQG